MFAFDEGSLWGPKCKNDNCDTNHGYLGVDYKYYLTTDSRHPDCQLPVIAPNVVGVWFYFKCMIYNKSNLIQNLT